jgi:DNA-binding NarL/FixJ family response regulator
MEQNDQNNPIGCYIFDDEKDAVNRLDILIAKRPNVKVYGKTTDLAKAVDAILETKPELVSIDIVMKGKTGFEVIEEIRKKGYYPHFVFATAHPNYSIRAIKTAAFDSLMKPLDIEEVKENVERYQSVRLLVEYQNGDDPSSFESLSQREKEIIQHLVNGKISAEISDLLFISKNTVDPHRRNILEKNRLKSTAKLIRHYLSSFRQHSSFGNFINQYTHQ